MGPNPSAIIFDWGNTLVDYPLETPEQQVTFIAGALSRHVGSGAPDDAFRHFNREAGDFRVKLFRERAAAALGVDATSKLVEDIEANLLQSLSAHARIIDGAAGAIESCRRGNIRVAVLSNTPWGTSAGFWRTEIQRHGLVDPARDVVVLCQDTGWRKPAAHGFLECLARLGVCRRRTLMVGDNYASDIVGATKVGLDAIWFNRQRRPPADPMTRHFHEWRDFTPLLHERRE